MFFYKVFQHMDSKNPQSSMAETISDGSTADWGCPKPAACMMVEITPCTMSNSASIKAVKDVSEQWKQEVAGWIAQARETGLTDVSPDPDLPFEKQIDVLSQIVEKTEGSIFSIG